jgi:hypothetical protein
VGSSGKGDVSQSTINQNFGTSFYTGTAGQGSNHAHILNQFLSVSIFLGSFGKGDLVANMSSRQLGQDLYLGSIGQGNNSQSLSSQMLASPLFLGGLADGHAAANAINQPFGLLQYAGGVSDGNEMIQILNQVFGESIFKGGMGDGFVDMGANQQSFGSALYLGGAGHGNKSIELPNRILGESIFKGGAGDGFAFIFSPGLQLPVHLLNFEASWEAAGVLTQWTTASEINNSHFDIQRSDNMVDFYTIGTLSGKGNSNVQNAYQFIDKSISQYPNVNTWYYRLRSVSTTNSEEISKVEVVYRNTLMDGTCLVYPNPTSHSLYINQKNINSKYEDYEITDLQGRTKQSGKLSSLTKIDVSMLPDGIYFFNIKIGNANLETYKITIIN